MPIASRVRDFLMNGPRRLKEEVPGKLRATRIGEAPSLSVSTCLPVSRQEGSPHVSPDIHVSERLVYNSPPISALSSEL